MSNRRFKLIRMFFCFGVILISGLGYSQETFNKRYALGQQTIFSGVSEVDGQFVVTGIATDTVGGLHEDALFCKIDVQGNLISHSNYGSQDHQLSTLFDDMEITQSNQIIQGGMSYKDGVNFGLIVWYDLNGDTLFTREFNSPNFIPGESDPIDSYYRIKDIALDSEGNIYLCANGGQDGIGNNFFVKMIDPDGIEVWEYLVDDPNYNLESCFSLHADSDGGVICSAAFLQYFNLFPVTSYIFKLTSDGILDWEIERNMLTDSLGAGHEFVINEGELIVGSNHFETYDGPGSVPALYSTNLEEDLNWKSYVGENFTSHGHRISSLKRAHVSGYIGAAQTCYDPNPTEPTDGEYNWDGQLLKFSDNGNLEWERKFSLVTSEYDFHEISDLSLCSDGGYIFCGEATDSDNDVPENTHPQHGWLVKVDEYGCLIPGCQDVSVDEESEIYFLLGPNPASDYLNIYLPSVYVNQRIELRDLQGKVLQSFLANQGNTTYMLDVSEYAQGTYVVSLMSGGRLLHSEKVIFSH